MRLTFREDALLQRASDVRRPDQVRPLPGVVVHGGVRLRRIEWLMRVEFVYEQEEAVVVARVLVQPGSRRRHRLGPGEVLLLAEVAARVVVGHELPAEHRRPDPAIVGPRLPGVALVAAFVLPAVEIRVVVLASRLEQMRVIGDELRRDAGATEVSCERLFPEFDRPPGLPEEVQRSAEQVVASRNARQGAGVVLFEHQRAFRERVEVGSVELGPTVAAQHVAVERIQQDDDCVLGKRWPGGALIGH